MDALMNLSLKNYLATNNLISPSSQNTDSNNNSNSIDNSTLNSLPTYDLASLLFNASATTNFNLQMPQAMQPSTDALNNNNINYEALLLALAKLPLNQNLFQPMIPNSTDNQQLNLAKNLLSPVKLGKNCDLSLVAALASVSANERTAISPPPTKRVCLTQENDKNDFLSFNASNCPPRASATTPVNITGVAGSSSSCNSVASSNQNSPVASSRRMSTTSTSSFSAFSVASGRNRTPQRKPAAPIPDEKKDEAYYERRKKNNDAAKRSRDSRRQKEELTAKRAASLEQENIQLKNHLLVLQNEIALHKAEAAKYRTLVFSNNSSTFENCINSEESTTNAKNETNQKASDPENSITETEPVKAEPVETTGSEDSSPLKFLSALLSAKNYK